MLIPAVTVRQLGATLWSSEEAYHLSRLEYPTPSNSFLKVGWRAGGGVLVLIRPWRVRARRVRV